MKKSIIFLLAIFLFSGISFAQEKPIRIGLKFGVPNLVGLNLEYVTPLLDSKLAPTLDLSSISISSGDAKINFSYLELGGNYYFVNQGKGLYGHFSFGRIGFKATYSDPVLGEGEGKIGLNLLNFKLGAKLGNGFYFRPEIGFGALAGSSVVSVKYTDPSTNIIVTEEEEIPGFLGGGVVFNLGFGVAF